MGLPTRERRREPQAVERGQPQEIRDQGPGLRTSSHPYVVTTSASGRRTWSQARARPASSSRSTAPTARPERRRRSVAASSAEPRSARWSGTSEPTKKAAAAACRRSGGEVSHRGPAVTTWPLSSKQGSGPHRQDPGDHPQASCRASLPPGPAQGPPCRRVPGARMSRRARPPRWPDRGACEPARPRSGRLCRPSAATAAARPRTRRPASSGGLTRPR